MLLAQLKICSPFVFNENWTQTFWYLSSICSWQVQSCGSNKKIKFFQPLRGPWGFLNIESCLHKQHADEISVTESQTYRVKCFLEHADPPTPRGWGELREALRLSLPLRSIPFYHILSLPQGAFGKHLQNVGKGRECIQLFSMLTSHNPFLLMV